MRRDVDSAKTATHVSLCAGYGGIDLGLKRAIGNMRTVAFCEIEAFACANLVSKMEAGLLDAAPIWTDLKTFPWPDFRGRVDILSGGYPCQPFSAAGKRLGKEDPRHLWPWIADGILAMEPSLCFFENVEGHISLGLSTVISDLEEMGYRATWGIFSAAEVGAPHQRKRVFIMAHHQRERVEELSGWLTGPAQYPAAWNGCAAGRNSWPARPSEPQHWWEPQRTVANHHCELAGSKEQRPERECGHLSGGCSEPAMGDATSTEWPQYHAGQHGSQDDPGATNEDAASWQAEPPLGRDSDGASGGLGYAELCVTCDNRTDELRLLGNGVVPATAATAFVTLLTSLQCDNDLNSK